MDDKVLFENKQIIIKHSNNNILYCKLIGFVNLNIVTLFDKEMEAAIRKTKTIKIISDTSEMRVMAKDAQEYNHDNLIPNWKRLGIKYNAVILSANIFGQTSTQALKDNIDKSTTPLDFIAKMFDNFGGALKWIENE